MVEKPIKKSPSSFLRYWNITTHMKKSPPSPLPPSRSSSSSTFSHASLSFSNVIPVSKAKPKSKPKYKKAKNPDMAALDKTHLESVRRRSSVYRGVTRHRWTGRFEAHLWDKNWQHPLRKKRGRQVYLGAYDDEAAAARAHDLAALKFCGPETILNFPVEMYTEEYEGMQAMTKEELLASLRRRSNGFARGVSKYRGVARHHSNGRWEARLGQVLGYKYLYLGTYGTEEEAAQAYDLAALHFKGPNAVTNFDSCLYVNYPRPFIKLAPRPETEPSEEEQGMSPLEETRVVPMDPTESMEQIVPTDDISAILWSFSMDEGFGAFPVLDLAVDRSKNNVSFEDNIEHLFETLGSGAGEVPC